MLKMKSINKNYIAAISLEVYLVRGHEAVGSTRAPGTGHTPNAMHKKLRAVKQQKGGREKSI